MQQWKPTPTEDLQAETVAKEGEMGLSGAGYSESNENRQADNRGAPAVAYKEIKVGTGDAAYRVDSQGLWLGSEQFATAPFRVTMAGLLYAAGATISGAITATTGAIGGWSINATSIYTGTEDHSGYTANAGDMTLYSNGSDASIHAKNWYIDTAGVLNCTAAIISGAITTTASSSIDGQYLTAGSVASASANLALRGWTFTGVFSSTDANTVSWAIGTFTASDGTAYSIAASNTDTRLTAAGLTSPMNARVYIYLDIATSTTEFQCTYTPATSIGNGKCLVAVAENGQDMAEFQVFGGIGGVRLNVSDLAADTTSTNEFVANTANIANAIITDAKITALAVSKLTAGTITSKAITLAVAAGTGDTYIAAGKTDFTNAQSGFILGIDDSDSDLAKLYVGDANHYFNFNGTTADATGTRTIENYVVGETVTAGHLVCLPSKTITVAHADFVTQIAYTDPAHADVNNVDQSYVGRNASGRMSTYLKFDFVGAPDLPAWNETDKVILALSVVSETIATRRYMKFYLLAADWAEDTITYNNAPATTGYPLQVYYLALNESGTINIDITELYKAAKAAANNYGFVITPEAAWTDEENIRFSGNGFSLTYIKNTAIETNPVYLADYSDYNNVKNILGITLDGGNAGDTVRVQTAGVYTGSFTAGEEYYLSDNIGNIAALATSILTDYWQPKIGRAKSSTELIIDIEKGRQFINSITFLLGWSASGASATTPDFYVPRQARECIIVYETYDSSANYYKGQLVLRKDRIISVSSRSTAKDGASAYFGAASATWAANTISFGITLSPNNVNTEIGTSNYVTFYFYE